MTRKKNTVQKSIKQKDMGKKLARSTSDAKLAGICSGVAKYFNLDPTIVRIAWAILVLVCGVGLIAYILCWILMPKEQ